MITQEEIDKAAKKFSFNKCKATGSSDIQDEKTFKAGVEFALQQLNTVTRFEVIDHSKDFKGRCYTKHDCSIELSLQDNNRTLKVFVHDR